ncbi:FlgO family outer membrane protein [Pseudoalteromonas shioyasakiensis]|uniref:FlgO family outer membrane protein n=1 Tax=Pseudoalteromonas shioyasakiensis TaxID=1190813 RepID=UPI0021172D61|nr:FlgO family outer membrane protein [Pseudoalteromonas shioyasakiensis]MCQ8877415.1 FlgO family outer membrane protein [Pseudoalteromonas shioyasakiensis]
MRLLIILFSLSLTACSLTSDEPEKTPSQVETPAMSAYTVHQYVNDLSTQLSHINGPFKSSARIAVTSFYLADELETGLANGQVDGLSQQIQESLITQFTQLGYNIIEYRLENTINLSASADSMLSRDITKLRQRQNIDYVITGTLTRQQHAYIVNARMVDTKDNVIASAASTEIPINVMWGDEKIQQRGGYIYRSEY